MTTESPDTKPLAPHSDEPKVNENKKDKEKEPNVVDATQQEDG